MLRHAGALVRLVQLPRTFSHSAWGQPNVSNETVWSSNRRHGSQKASRRPCEGVHAASGEAAAAHRRKRQPWHAVCMRMHNQLKAGQSGSAGHATAHRHAMVEAVCVPAHHKLQVRPSEPRACCATPLAPLLCTSFCSQLFAPTHQPRGTTHSVSIHLHLCIMVNTGGAAARHSLLALPAPRPPPAQGPGPGLSPRRCISPHAAPGQPRAETLAPALSG